MTRHPARPPTAPRPTPRPARRRLAATALGAALLVGSAGLLLPAGPAQAATKTEIKLGNTVPYSGPASFYGIVGKATVAYFDMVNDQGGINGRKVKVISLDDSLSPPKTVEQTRKLVEEEEVDAVINQVGTAASSSVRKYLNAKGVPQLFVMSGSNNFQQPKAFPYSTSALMNYEFEAQVYGRTIARDRPNAKVGILYQNDDYGKDYLKGLKEGLGKPLVADVTYEQSDPTMDSQVLALRAAGVDTLLLAAYSKQVSQAMRKMTELGWKPQVFISHVSAQIKPTLTNVGLENVVGLMTTAVVKDPTDTSWHDGADYKAYLAWLNKYIPDADKLNSTYASVYTYCSALAQVLKSAGDDLSRENILRQMTRMKDFPAPLLLPGVTMSMSSDNYNLYRKVQLMRFDGKRWVPQGAPVGE